MENLSKKGDTVLDPFLGSGTTMKVAKDLERNCIGIKINEEYINMTKKRLNWGHSLGNIEWEFIKT
jgi:site-specific DNA-methyltransferase (adenine-specific)